MNGIEVLINIAKTSEMMFMALANTLKDEPMRRAGEGGNHAMWNVGHVAVSDRGVISMVSGQENPLADWDGLFKHGTIPTDDATAYPSYDEALAAFTASRAALVSYIAGLTDADLDKKTEGIAPEWEPLFGTHGQALSMVCWHPMQHAGQLTVIRKDLGMPLAMS